MIQPRQNLHLIENRRQIPLQTLLLHDFDGNFDLSSYFGGVGVVGGVGGRGPGGLFDSVGGREG
jgi:hypothetical protein